MEDKISKIRSVLINNRKSLLAKQNVVATGLGYKVKEGKKTDEIVIICSVVRKVRPEDLSASEFVPETIEEELTDVVETGNIRALQAPTGRFRPAPGGVSIGHVDITAGTLGCVVKRNGEKMILSNNHVLANSNAASIGDSILQPGPFDGGSIQNDKIATLEDFIQINFGGDEPSKCGIGNSVAGFFNFLAGIFGRNTRLKAVRPLAAENKVDAAIARPLDPNDILEEILNIGAIAGLGNVNLGDALQKMGRTTGFTQGTVDQIDVSVNVGYGSNQTALFTEQILAGAMSAGGDSGSAVLDNNKNLIGLLFAGSDTTTIINPIDFVFSALNLTL